MHHFPINFAAVLAAAVARTAIGAIWYSDALFGKMFAAPSGTLPAGGAATARSLALSVAASFLMAFVFLHILHANQVTSAGSAAPDGLFYGIGLLAAASVSQPGRPRRSLGQLSIDGGYQAGTLLVMALILGAWN